MPDGLGRPHREDPEGDEPIITGICRPWLGDGAWLRILEKVRPLAEGSAACSLFMVLFSVVASVVLTVLVNLLR